MNNNNINTNSSAPSPKGTQGWIWALVVIIIIVGLGAVYLLKTEKQEVVIEDKPIVEQVDDGWPDQIYAYVGEVANLTDDGFVLAASKNGNYLTADSQFKVMVNEQTQVVKVIIPKGLPGIKAGESGEFFKREIITFKDIVVGDQVTVIAGENIKGQDEFEAIRIEVRLAGD